MSSAVDARCLINSNYDQRRTLRTRIYHKVIIEHLLLRVGDDEDDDAADTTACYDVEYRAEQIAAGTTAAKRTFTCGKFVLIRCYFWADSAISSVLPLYPTALSAVKNRRGSSAKIEAIIVGITWSIDDSLSHTCVFTVSIQSTD